MEVRLAIPDEKTQGYLAFSFVTVIFLITQFVLFNGFNGTDDLHYAMLSARLLEGKYNPFEVNDIFSGRMLLIAFQALLYKLGGISVLSTALGTIMATITSCWLMVSKMMILKRPSVICLACSLFYFSPALPFQMTGIMPDPYIMLLGIIIYLLVNPFGVSSKSDYRNDILAGVLIALTLLIKETILVFLPFAAFLQVFFRGKTGFYSTLVLGSAFLGTVVLLGIGYHFFTGDAFFKLAQIRNSTYPNPCNFETAPLKELVIRLTYGVYVTFIVTGFYPVVLACVLLAAKFCNWRDAGSLRDPTLVSFCSLLLISLYFPFSLDGYQPLCGNSRHFLFLLPFAISFLLTFDFAKGERITGVIFLALLFISLLVCYTYSGEKWQLLFYALTFSFFLISFFYHQLPLVLRNVFLSLLLFASIFEKKILNRNEWFYDLSQLSKKLESDYYYFPDHDNMMHWKLLHQFNDKDYHYVNLEKEPFKIFKIYNERPDSAVFHPGWFVLNRKYTVLSKETLSRLDSVQKKWSYVNHVRRNSIEATFIESGEQLIDLENVLKR